MPGRNRVELSGTGAVRDLARRLRELRDAKGWTLRQLAARSGYSISGLSAAERGRRAPSWDLTEAFVASLGENPPHWRQLWELAAASGRAEAAAEAARPALAADAVEAVDAVETTQSTLETDEPHTPAPDGVGETAGPAAPPAASPAPVPAGTPGSPARRRLAGLHRSTLITFGAVVLAAATAGALALTAGSGHAGARPPALTTTATGPAGAPTPAVGSSDGFSIPPAAVATPSSTYSVLKSGQVVLNAGQRINLDVSGSTPWPVSDTADEPYDLEFFITARTLNAVGTQISGSSLAEIKNPTNSYDDCRNTSDYGVYVPTADIREGTEFCLITDQRHRSLCVIQAVKRDAAGLPVTVVLTATTWDHIVPPGG
jgi:transcriptional regulator with XRE-family HTH domain